MARKSNYKGLMYKFLQKKIEEKILGVRIKDSIKDNSIRARSLARLAL